MPSRNFPKFRHHFWQVLSFAMRTRHSTKANDNLMIVLFRFVEDEARRWVAFWDAVLNPGLRGITTLFETSFGLGPRLQFFPSQSISQHSLIGPPTGRCQPNQIFAAGPNQHEQRRTVGAEQQARVQRALSRARVPRGEAAQVL